MANNLSKLNQSIYSQIIQNEHLLIWNSKLTQHLNICLYNCQTETAIFIGTGHEKIIMAFSYLNFYKYFLHFELLVSNTIKNETRKKFKNLLGTNLVKYSSKFLAHIKNI